MRKTRVLAALLCLMMIATAIPMMQVSASTTYTEAEILTGVEADNSIAFADYAEAGIAFAKLKGTGATISNWDNNGVFTSHAEYLEETETYELTAKTVGERTQAVVAAEDGLTFSFGNRKRYGSDIVPYNDGGYYTPRTIVSWSNDVVDSPVNDGAVKITVKLLNQYSQGAIEFIPDDSSTAETDDSKMDIIFNVNGFTIRGAGTAAYTMDVDTYYDIVIKKEVDSYAIYAKKESDSTYTKVTTYAADYTASSVVGVSAALPCGNTANTDVMVTTTTTMDGDKEVKKNTYSWVKPGAGVIDDDNSDNVVTSVLKDNVTAYLTMSQVSYKSIASYSKVDAALNAILAGAFKTNKINFANYAHATTPSHLDALVNAGVGLQTDVSGKNYVMWSSTPNAGPHVAAALQGNGTEGYKIAVDFTPTTQPSNLGDRTTVWQLDKTNHLQLSAGNFCNINREEYPVSPYQYAGKAKLSGYVVGDGAIKMEVALQNAGSVASIDFDASITTDDIIVKADGFTISGVSYPYTIIPGTYYTLVVKKDGAGYSLYAKADGATDYDAVATYTTDLSQANALYFIANYPAGVDTKVYATEGANSHWLAATEEAPEGATVALESVTAYPTMSSFSVKSVTTYEMPEDTTEIDKVLDGATKGYTVNFNDYYTNTNFTGAIGDAHPAGTTVPSYAGADLARLHLGEGGYPTHLSHISPSNAGDFCRAEKILTDGSLTSNGTENPRLKCIEVTSDGLAVRAGNDGVSGSDTTIPGESGDSFGWQWKSNDPNAVRHFQNGKLSIDTGYTGSVLFKVRLDYDGSSARAQLVDGTNGNASVGFVVSNAGIQMINATAIAYGDGPIVADNAPSDAKFPLTTGKWYDILLRNNGNRFTLYARESGSGAFTNIVTGSATGGNGTFADAYNELRIDSQYNTTGKKATKLVTTAAGTKEYLASYVEAQGWVAGEGDVTEIKDGNGSRTLSQVTFAKVTTYKEGTTGGVTLESIVGNNAVELSSYVNDAASKEILKATGSGAPYGAYNGGNAGVNADGEMFISYKEGGQSYIGLHALPKFTPDKAVEISATIPVGSTASLNLRGAIDGTNRVYADFGGSTPGAFGVGSSVAGITLTNNRGVNEGVTAIERTYLLTYDEVDGTTYAKAWMKNPETGKYLYLGACNMKTGDPGYGFRIEQGPAGTTDYIINKVVVYDKDDAVEESATLPAGAADMYQFVNQDFNEAPDSKVYELFRSSPSTGTELKYENGKLKIEIPAKDGDAEIYSFLKTNNIFVPVGGYAEMSVKPDYRQPFQIDSRDGSSSMSLVVKSGGITYNGISSALNVEPGLWLDLKILRDAEGDFTIYAKKEGSKWLKLFENMPTLENDHPPLMQIGGYAFAGADKETDAAYVEYLNVYGPKGDGIFLLDGTGNTAIVKDGDALANADNLQLFFLPSEEYDAKLIFAYYDVDGYLLGTDLTTDVLADADQNEVSLTKDLSSPPAGTATIKIFLWKADNLVTPLYEARTITVAQ